MSSLDNQETGYPSRWGRTLIVAAVVGAGAFWAGDRHGRKAGPLPVQPTQTVAQAVAAPPAVAPPPQAPPAPAVDAGPAVAAGTHVIPAPVAAGPVPSAVDAGPPATGEHVLTATLSGSLDESIEAKAPTEGPALTMVVSRLLVWWLHPARDVRPGDKLWVVYELPEGQEPLVLGLRYQSLKLGLTRTIVRFQAPGSAFARYYDDTGAELEERLVDSPLDDYEQITSLLRDGRGHKGVDFKVPVGAEVHSPVEGVVTRRNWNWHANGDCVALEDKATGRELMFLHMSAVADEVKVGAKIAKGQVLGKTGNTGHTTAPHLHYQVMSPQQKVLDPFAVQPTTRRKLSGDQLVAFHAAVTEMLPSFGGK